MTHAGTLLEHFGENYIPSCNGAKEEETGTFVVDNESRPITFEDLDLPTLFINSGRIILNAHQQDILLSSRTNFQIGAGINLEIMSKNSTTIEASNIYLGRSAKDTETSKPTSQAENMVLGKALDEIMILIVDILSNLKVTGTVGGISGTPSPDVMTKITKLKTIVDSKDFLSSYHYIETNDSKPEDNQ
tara:strand:+ start:21 stop:587 length:567 start_codon:yes stop_codon:yes gene_type:complete